MRLSHYITHYYLFTGTMALYPWNTMHSVYFSDEKTRFYCNFSNGYTILPIVLSDVWLNVSRNVLLVIYVVVLPNPYSIAVYLVLVIKGVMQFSYKILIIEIDCITFQRKFK